MHTCSGPRKQHRCAEHTRPVHSRTCTEEEQDRGSGYNHAVGGVWGSNIGIGVWSMVVVKGGCLALRDGGGGRCGSGGIHVLHIWGVLELRVVHHVRHRSVSGLVHVGIGLTV